MSHVFAYLLLYSFRFYYFEYYYFSIVFLVFWFIWSHKSVIIKKPFLSTESVMKHLMVLSVCRTSLKYLPFLQDFQRRSLSNHEHVHGSFCFQPPCTQMATNYSNLSLVIQCKPPRLATCFTSHDS